MSNYIKKYNGGEIVVDLPYNSFIHELPLFDFNTFRNKYNISLVYNHKIKKAGTNPFNIGTGFKLNVQKKLIIENNKPVKLLDVNGNFISLIENIDLSDSNNLFTFLDDSKRVLRFISNGFEIENEDLSKEVYNQAGNIIASYDKYEDLYISYTYENGLLKGINCESDDRYVELNYTNNVLTSISYGGATITLSYNLPNLTVYHYSGVTFDITITNSKYTVLGSAVENAIVTYSKECTFSNYNIVLTSKVGTDTVDTMIYSYPELVSGDCGLHSQVNVSNTKGLEKRIQFLDEKMLYSYELDYDYDDVHFDDDLFQNNVTIYNTLDDGKVNSFKGNFRYSDGTNMIKDGVINNAYKLDRQAYSNVKGNYLVTGWIKSDSIGSQTIYVSNNTGGYLYSFNVVIGEANKWQFFAYQFEIDANFIYVYSNPSGVELKDLRITYQISYIIGENNKSYATYKEDVLINKTTLEVIPMNQVQFYYRVSNGDGFIQMTASDLMRYNRRLIKINNNNSDNDITNDLYNEIYYNNGKNAINDVILLQVVISEGSMPEDLDDYDVGYRYYNFENEYSSIIKKYNGTNGIVFQVTNNKNGSHYSCQYLNAYYDVVKETKDNITTLYTRDKGLITRKQVEGLYNISYTYDVTNNTVLVKDEYGEGVSLSGITYHMNPVWGVVYKNTTYNGTTEESTYDDDMSSILEKKFNNQSFGIKNLFGYSKGNLNSLTCDTLNYGFEYEKGELIKVNKFGTTIEEQTHDDFVHTLYYPNTSNFVYNKQYNYDEYDRLTSVTNELENTYSVHSFFDENTGEHRYLINNACSKLIMTEDKILNQKERFVYNDKELLEKIVISDSNNYNTQKSVENFTYDDVKRIKTKNFIHDITNNVFARDEIVYLKDEDDPTVDTTISSYKFTTKGATSGTTTYHYDNLKRISKKITTFPRVTATKELQYSHNKVIQEMNSIATLTKTSSKATSYAYDSFNRLSAITSNNKTTSYEYDNYGRLIRENNQALDKTIVYNYNNIGNIIESKIYNYTVTDPTTLLSTKTYEYDYSIKDKLTKYNSTNILYDSLGYPKVYNGYNLIWNKGKLVELSKGSLQTGTEQYTYSYNAYGQRVSKTYCKLEGTNSNNTIAIGELTQYNKKYIYDHSGRLIREEGVSTYYNDGSYNESIDYIYDANNIIGMRYQKGSTVTQCFFERNILGDVTAIYSLSGALKVKYLYDAYGNCTISNETTDSFLAQINPIRYRGYYYDVETSLFSISSRYYSPELGRFIQPADVSTLNPSSINGLNLYSYANNNPIGIAYSSSGFGANGGMVSSLAINGSVVPGGGLINKGFHWPNLDFLGTGFGLIENTFSVIAGVIDGVRKIKHLDKLASLDKASDQLMIIGAIINAGLSIYNNLTNSNLTRAQKAGNIVGDIVYIAASSGATWGISALTAMIPVVGPFLAPIVGFGFGTALDQFWHGEDIFGIKGFSFNPGGKSIDEWIKEFLTELFGG